MKHRNSRNDKCGIISGVSAVVAADIWCALYDTPMILWSSQQWRLVRTRLYYMMSERNRADISPDVHLMHDCTYIQKANVLLMQPALVTPYTKVLYAYLRATAKSWCGVIFAKS